MSNLYQAGLLNFYFDLGLCVLFINVSSLAGCSS